ncbi:hypothetical protein HMPREF1261_02236 [Corynebacterium sp. KPL1818]|uniref:hypothetical protein n=1 Tax=Corynebacterium sp. KPL1818 TaxID=1203559 RepID=UPI0003B900B3|nr:hypothetical protein [Corynebacterium sp. KPL1818]ERS58177.1 hypothetical protein HMPREF1261_02236 [Corynebacterium sp. KPL1818]
MTDTVRKAADILYQRSEVEGHAAQTACQEHAQALHDAGLLAPDLPTLRHDYDKIEAPVRYSLINIGYDSERYDDDSALVGVWAGDVKFLFGGYNEASAYMSTEQARQFALALLAAAKYQEQQ